MNVDPDGISPAAVNLVLLLWFAVEEWEELLESHVWSWVPALAGEQVQELNHHVLRLGVLQLLQFVHQVDLGEWHELPDLFDGLPDLLVRLGLEFGRSGH